MPIRLLRDGRLDQDEWRRIDGESAADAVGAVILPHERWLRERDSWTARNLRLGVLLNPADSAEALAADLPRLSLIAVNFPAIGEGRGYTQARLLRERCRYAGELRAVGRVHQDQVFLLARCGFNAFELEEAEIDGARAALGTFSAAYQPSNDGGLMRHLRHRR